MNIQITWFKLSTVLICIHTETVSTYNVREWTLSLTKHSTNLTQMVNLLQIVHSWNWWDLLKDINHCQKLLYKHTMGSLGTKIHEHNSSKNTTNCTYGFCATRLLSWVSTGLAIVRAEFLQNSCPSCFPNNSIEGVTRSSAIAGRTCDAKACQG